MTLQFIVVVEAIWLATIYVQRMLPRLLLWGFFRSQARALRALRDLGETQ